MKPIIFCFFIILSFFGTAQQMVQTPKDLYLICQNDNKFIGKPLKDLFKELKPPIKLVLASGGWAEEAPRFAFIFTSIQVFDQYRRQNKFPIRLIVIPNKLFTWDWQERNRNKTRDHYLDWTKEDEETYGNLIIMAIRLEGEYNECDYES